MLLNGPSLLPPLSVFILQMPKDKLFPAPTLYAEKRRSQPENEFYFHRLNGQKVALLLQNEKEGIAH